jgi:hypothetical protein
MRAGALQHARGASAAVGSARCVYRWNIMRMLSSLCSLEIANITCRHRPGAVADPPRRRRGRGRRNT